MGFKDKDAWETLEKVALIAVGAYFGMEQPGDGNDGDDDHTDNNEINWHEIPLLTESNESNTEILDDDYLQSL